MRSSRAPTLIVTDNLYGGVATHAMHFLPVLMAHRPVIVRFLRRSDNPPADPRVTSLAGIDFDEVALPPSPASAAAALPWLARQTFGTSLFIKGGPDNGSLRLDRFLRRRGAYLTLEQNCPLPTPKPAIDWRQVPPRVGLWYWRRRARLAYRWHLPHRIVAVSDWVAEGLRTAWGCPRRDIAVVMNGCDTEQFQPSDAARRAARAAWGVGPDDLVLGTVGRLERHQKGLDTLLRALAPLRSHLAERAVKLVLVGDGEPEEVAAIRQLVTDVALTDIVIFPGPTSRPQDAWNGMDLVVLPSRFEGASLSLLEAMACERPVLATPVGSVTDVIRSGENGMIVAELALTEAIREAVTWSSERRRAMGVEARKEVVAHHRAALRAGQLVDVIERTEASRR